MGYSRILIVGAGIMQNLGKRNKYSHSLLGKQDPDLSPKGTGRRWSMRLLPIFAFVLFAHAGDGKSQVAIANVPNAEREEQIAMEKQDGIHLKLEPDDLNARGQSLDNTFYEISGVPPYGPKKVAANRESSRETAPIRTASVTPEDAKSRWGFWVAGAAGVVGLGAIGYWTLVEDSPKSPEKHVTVLSDK